MLRAGEPQRALRPDQGTARARAVRRHALSAAAVGRQARRRRRHRVHRRLDRRRPAGRPHRDDRSRDARSQGRQGHAAEGRRGGGVRRSPPAPSATPIARASRASARTSIACSRRRSTAAPGVPHDLRSRRPAGGPAQLQQPGADPPEPLPARLGALPALAPRLSLRVRAEPAGFRSRHHAPVLGLDDAAVSAGRSDQRLHHPDRVQGLHRAGCGRGDDRRRSSRSRPRRRPAKFRAMANGPDGRCCSPRSTTSSAT